MDSLAIQNQLEIKELENYTPRHIGTPNAFTATLNVTLQDGMETLAIHPRNTEWRRSISTCNV